MKIKAFLGIGYANANREGIIEIEDEELEGLTEEEKDKLIDEYMKEWMWNFIDTGYQIIEE